MAIPTAQAYLFNAPSGVPGAVSRPDESNVEPIMLGATPPVLFGLAVKYDTNGSAVVPATGDAATVFAGIVIREVPSISGTTAQGLTDAVPNTVQPQGLLVRGYASIVCVAGTPVRGGVVYMQITLNNSVIPGSFRADGTDSGNAVALTITQATWAVDGLDANNNAEIRVAR